MTELSNSFTEPISAEYQLSGPDVVADVHGIIDHKNNPDFLMVLKPKIFEGTRLCLGAIVLRPNSSLAPTDFRVKLVLLDDLKELPTHFILSFQERSKEVSASADAFGGYANRTNGQIRRFTHILAPYEDALCIALAKQKNKPVRRFVDTTNKTVKESLRIRGFKDIDDSDQYFEKTFPVSDN